MKPIGIQTAREQLVRIDDRLNSAHLLIGGLAVRQYVATRDSHDIDLVLDHGTFHDVLKGLYPTKEWEVRELKANAHRPTINIRHNSRDLGEIVLGPKITERGAYEYLDWDYLLAEGDPLFIDGHKFKHIVVPRCAHLAFTKIISFLGRDASHTEKRRQDLQDFRDLSNQRSFDPISFLGIARRMGAVEYIRARFEPTPEEQEIIVESSFYGLPDSLSLAVEFPNDSVGAFTGSGSFTSFQVALQGFLERLLLAPKDGISVQRLEPTAANSDADVASGLHAKSLTALLIQLGLLQQAGPELVRFESDLSRAFVASLLAHAKDGLPMFRDWSEQASGLSRYNSIREFLRDLEILRIAQTSNPPAPARRVRSVIVVIRAKHDGEDRYLMEYNPSWDGGMWWFLGGVIGDATGGVIENARLRLEEELGLHPTCFSVVELLGQGEISDWRISERLGVYSHYQYSVVAAELDAKCQRNRALSEKDFEWNTQAGRVRLTRRFRWMSWDDIETDHPLAHHASNILKDLAERISTVPVSPLEIVERRQDYIVLLGRGKKFSSIIVDAGGVLFEDEFWFEKVKRYYNRYLDTTTHKFVRMPFAQYATHSRLLGICSHATDGLSTEEILRQFSQGLGCDYGSSFKRKAGRILPGALDVLIGLRELGVKVFILTSAPWRSDEFDEQHGSQLVDSSGARLYTASASTKELGMTKLSPRLYQTVLSDWGLSSADTLFVGHDVHELVGARFGGGITTVAVNVHHSEESVVGAIADYQLSRFEDVLALVRSSQTRLA